MKCGHGDGTEKSVQSHTVGAFVDKSRKFTACPSYGCSWTTPPVVTGAFGCHEKSAVGTAATLHAPTLTIRLPDSALPVTLVALTNQL